MGRRSELQFALDKPIIYTKLRMAYLISKAKPNPKFMPCQTIKLSL
ncbi:hypothetical protein [Moraxella lacunata]